MPVRFSEANSDRRNARTTRAGPLAGSGARAPLGPACARSGVHGVPAQVQYHVTFSEGRLGMMLADAPEGDGVHVVAFTQLDGELGPAELGGKVAVGDQVCIGQAC